MREDRFIGWGFLIGGAAVYALCASVVGFLWFVPDSGMPLGLAASLVFLVVGAGTFLYCSLFAPVFLTPIHLEQTEADCARPP